jgi:hypothetical protein
MRFLRRTNVIQTVLKRSLLIGLLGGVLCFDVCIPSHAQQSSSPAQSAADHSAHTPHFMVRKGPPLTISDRVEAFHIDKLSAHETLQYISRKYYIVIGVEAAVYKTDPKINVDFSGGTVRDLLNAFVAAAPDYRWQNDKAVIHVFRNGPPSPLANLSLNYPGASQKQRFEVWQTLHFLPEYLNWMKTNQCRSFERIRPLDIHFNNAPIDIAPGQMTVAQLLDQVATKSSDGFWAVLQFDPSEPGCRVSVIDRAW